MSVTKAEVTKAAVSYTLSLGYEIKKEQLDVIVQYVLTEISKVHANLFHRSFPKTTAELLTDVLPPLFSPKTPQPQQLGENEGDAIQSQWIFRLIRAKNTGLL